MGKETVCMEGRCGKGYIYTICWPIVLRTIGAYFQLPI